MSGLLAGILLARTVAGLVAQLAGWRAMYGIGALLMLGLVAVLWRELPRSDEERTAQLSYGRLLRSLGTLVRAEPVLRRRSVYGALTFAAFGVFWTSMAFLLSRPPFGYSQAIIGLFGLAGLAGALAASFAGRLADRGLVRYSTGGFLLVALLSFGLLALGGRSVLLLIAGVVLLDLGVQGTHITNQSQIYRLRAEARSRLTTVYMTSYFIGGALGSATSALVFDRFGWSGVCLLGALYLTLAVLYWLTEIVAGAPASECRERFLRVLPEESE
jgi:predicted MFS family arabinose efflux permease